MGFGFLIDRKFETMPWGLLVGLVVGFGSFVLRLMRLARQFEAIQAQEAEAPPGESRGSDAEE